VIPRPGILAVATLFLAAPASASEEAAAWTDEAIWQTAGRTEMLKRALSGEIYGTEAVRSEIRRIGVVPACRMIADHVAREAETVSARFRPLLVSEVRAVVPRGETFAERVSISPSGHRFGRLMAQIGRKAPELYRSLSGTIDEGLIPALSRMDGAEGEWRGPFADWDFDGPNQTVWNSACLLARLDDPSAAKSAFDGFYRKRSQ